MNSLNLNETDLLGMMSSHDDFNEVMKNIGACKSSSLGLRGVGITDRTIKTFASIV